MSCFILFVFMVFIQIEIEAPRWCIGWMVYGSDEDIEKLRSAVDAFYEGEEQIRKVRIGLQYPGLRARIPWRTMLTPMIAPMIHWNRAYKYLAEGGYKAISKEHGESVDSCVFSEIYVTSEDDKSHYYIDYIALLGDTTNIWEDSFPNSQTPQNEMSGFKESIDESVDGPDEL